MSAEFRGTLDLLENTTKNLFITGRAGTGKSTLLNYFRSITLKNVAVLAPTGVAALNVNGQTIHSFFRFKPDITLETVEKLGFFLTRKYRGLDTLIIDEISMVRADLLDCIDKFLRLNGNDASLPFGGVQLVFIGDMYQLPPVVTREEEDMFRTHYRSPYFFDAHSIREVKFRYVELGKHYRQRDPVFIGILDAIRNNNISERQIEELNARVDPSFVPKESDLYLTVTTTNRISDSINEAHLATIRGREYAFRGALTGKFDRKLLPTDEVLVLKEGSQIMMLNNDSAKRWVNGSVGKIIRINVERASESSITVLLASGAQVEVTPYTWELFRFSLDTIAHKLVSKSVGTFVQYPMALAWAVTIHKSQGKTFDHVIIDIGEGTFAHGQLYVALSRCTTLGGIVLTRRIDRKHILMDERIVNFLKGFELLPK